MKRKFAIVHSPIIAISAVSKYLLTSESPVNRGFLFFGMCGFRSVIYLKVS